MHFLEELSNFLLVRRRKPPAVYGLMELVLYQSPDWTVVPFKCPGRCFVLQVHKDYFIRISVLLKGYITSYYRSDII